MEQQIGFCTSSDGTRIAYATLGEGPPIVYVWPWGGSLDADFGHPEGRAYLEELAHGRMLVRFDRRGIGASQREVDDLSLEAEVADLAGVIDRLGLMRFDLIGVDNSCAIGVTYAVAHPERVGRLVLHSPYTCGSDVADATAVRELAGLMRTNWSLARRVLAGLTFPDGPVEAQRWFSQQLREGASPETAARHLEGRYALDLRDLFPKVKAPTLILHRRNYRAVPLSVARNVAALVPNARLVVLDDGPSHYSFDSAECVRLIRQFLGEGSESASVPVAPAPAAVHTILFTDIEGSTALTDRMGDAAARDVLREHERITREALKAHGGSEVKTMGDGFMASFGSATKALECAVAIQQAFAEALTPDPSPAAAGEGQYVVPIRVRIGLNAGEPIAEDDPGGRSDLFGTAVIVAARIAAEAHGGEILVSDVVRQLVAGKNFLFNDRGEQALKGFEDPVRVWEVRWGE